ncbi:hypothetical protein ACXR2T_01990 [Leucobacter sp. HY1910]
MDANEQRPRRADRAGIVIFIALGALILALTAVASIRRIWEILAGGPITLLAQFMSTPASVSMGEAGSHVEAQFDAAFITVPSLSPAAIGPAVLEPLITLLTVATVIGCLTILAFKILRGQVFGRTQTRSVVAAGLTGLVGFALAPVFGSIAANDALFALTGENTEVALFVVSPTPFLVAGFAISIVVTAFAVGERMQRDTEGLV